MGQNCEFGKSLLPSKYKFDEIKISYIDNMYSEKFISF